MANITEIAIGDSNYTIKDAEARTQSSNLENKIYEIAHNGLAYVNRKDSETADLLNRTGSQFRKEIANHDSVLSSLLSSFFVSDELITIDGYEALQCEDGQKLHGSRPKLSGIENDSYKKYERQNVWVFQVGVDILYLNGDVTGMSKDTKKTLLYRFGKNSGSCSCKWQGSSSLNYPKKNYTITIDTNVELKSGWGKHKKYVLKSEFQDYSHCKNVVCGKLWYQITKNREWKNLTDITTEANDVLTTESGVSLTGVNSMILSSPHGGSIDGFPVAVVLNDEYIGLYTLGIPKDDWMFGMENRNNHCAIINADNEGSLPCRFRSMTTAEELDNEESFAVEFATDDMTNSKIAESINRALLATMNGTGTNYREQLGQYIDIDSAMDYLIYSSLLTNWDGIHHNYNLYTYDGTKWGISAYDLDNTFGERSVRNGEDADYSPTAPIATPLIDSSDNRLFYLIRTYDTDRLKARYRELRSSILSESNVFMVFHGYMNMVPKYLMQKELEVWPQTPKTMTRNLEQILNNYFLRCKYIDGIVENM